MNNVRQWGAYTLGIGIFLILIPWLMFYVSTIFPAALSQKPIWARVISLLFLVPGIWLMLLSNLHMHRIGKGNPVDGFNVAVGQRTQYLMRDGVYNICRNPMLLGTFLFYIGIALVLNKWSALLIPILFILYMYWHVKKFEEPRLLRDFGQAYREYQEQVPMLFPDLKSLGRIPNL